MRLRQVLVELRRRKVFRACALYIVAAWAAVQVADQFFPAINVPEEAIRYVWLTVAFLFPLAAIFAWRYDVSLDGITRTPPASLEDDFDASLRRTDFALLAALSVVAIAVIFQFATRIEPGAVRLDESISPFSIAVLPFDDLSGNPEEQYFVSGMQSALIDGLSRVRNLRVTSKVSTLPFRQAGGSLLDIAMQLGVARVVEGTVLRNGDRVSIALRMHDVEKDQQVWSDRYEDDLSNILFLQAQAAQEIANQVRVQLGPEEQEQFAAAKPVNREAYLAVLKGIFYVERVTPEDMRIGATHFQRAVELDPDYALGHWGLAKLCGFQAQIGLLTPDEARATCMAPAVRAMELDPFLPEAHWVIASILTWLHFDWDGARPYWERAVELNPSYAEAHIFYSHYLGIIGELEKSTEHMQRAVDLDPLNPLTIGLSSIQLMMVGEFEQAIDAAERALAMAPGYAFAYSPLARAHHVLGNESEAVDALASTIGIIGGYSDAAKLVREAYRRDGYADAHRQLAEYLVALSATQHVPAEIIAGAFALGGDYDSAMDWHEMAFERGDPDVPYLGVLIKDPVLRQHPRFRPLLEKLELDYWVENL